MDVTWIIYALLSAIAAAFVAIFAKIGLGGIDPNTATAIRAVIMAIFLIIVVAVQGKLTLIQTIFENHKALTFIILSGVAGALSWLFYFLALSRAEVKQIVPIDRLSIVFAILFAFLILGEKITWKAAIGAVFVVIGAIMVALF